jgi:ketosteroid isomerase-like protein
MESLMPRLAAHAGRADDRRVIDDLNRHYIRAAEQADVAWYEQHLADDYVCITVDGALSDRAAFLRRISQPYRGGHFEAVDARIRFIGELALVHAGFKYTKPDGRAGSGRYTDIYTQRQGRWLCVSAHFNRF